ncbi:MAG TPA: hypothetical protein VNK03_04015 [Gammaproteobacteria bacterium]|nr:hypothetical protein [Gammaproteobacteria bacterium]
MEKWLIFFSIFKDLLKIETKNTWWAWAKDTSVLFFKLMLTGGVGFAIWSFYSYLRIDSVEAVASAQMSGILFGVVVAVFLLYFLIKVMIKKFVKSSDSAYSNMFELSALLYKDLEKIKCLGISLFKKKPMIISGASIAAAYVLFTLLKSNAMKKKQDWFISKES